MGGCDETGGYAVLGRAFIVLSLAVSKITVQYYATVSRCDSISLIKKTDSSKARVQSISFDSAQLRTDRRNVIDASIDFLKTSLAPAEYADFVRYTITI